MLAFDKCRSDHQALGWMSCTKSSLRIGKGQKPIEMVQSDAQNDAGGKRNNKIMHAAQPTAEIALFVYVEFCAGAFAPTTFNKK